MMRLASEALERVPRDEREIASLTLCISQRQMLELKAELERIEELLLQRYPSDDARAGRPGQRADVSAIAGEGLDHDALYHGLRLALMLAAAACTGTRTGNPNVPDEPGAPEGITLVKSNLSRAVP